MAMETKDIADFVIYEANLNCFMTEKWFRSNRESVKGLVKAGYVYTWGLVPSDVYCRPLTYVEAENGIKELMQDELWHDGTYSIVQRTKKGVVLEKAV
jgi:hypothetical protein